MDIKQVLIIGIRVSGSMSLLLILGALFFESLYHKIDVEMKYTGNGKKFLDYLAIGIDKGINYVTGAIGYVVWWILLWQLGYDKLFWVWVTSMLSIFGIVNFLKRLSKKQRPSDAKFTLKDYSFPSWHTALATTGLLNLSLLISVFVPDILRIFEFFFMAVLAGGFVGRSRRYLKVHWISDVLVGLLLGVFCFLVSCAIIIW